MYDIENVCEIDDVFGDLRLDVIAMRNVRSYFQLLESDWKI